MSGGIPLAGILNGSLPCQCPDGVYQVEQNDPNDGDGPQHYHRVEATCSGLAQRETTRNTPSNFKEQQTQLLW